MTTDNNELTAGDSVSRDNTIPSMKIIQATKAIAELQKSFEQQAAAPAMKMVLGLKEALQRARSLPGRPPTDILIKQIMFGMKMTRAQAKAHMKKLDLITAEKLQQMEQGDHVVNNVSRITTAVSSACHVRR